MSLKPAIQTESPSNLDSIMPRTNSRLTLIAAILTVIVWGSAFPAIREGLKAFTPFHVALLRYLAASLVLLVYALVSRMPLPDRQDIPRLALLGFIGFTIYNALLNWGEVTVPSAVASFIIAGAPIFIALLATFFLGERLRPLGWLGILIGFGGVTVIAFSNGSGFQFDPRAIVILIGAVAQSIYSVGQKPLLRRYGAFRFTTYAIGFGTLFLLVFTPGLPEEVRQASPSALTAVIYLGIFPGAIGYGLWSFVLSRMPALRAASLLYLVPAMALIIGWFWLGEVPSAIAVFGGALVLCGVIVVNTLGRRRRAIA